MKTPANPLAFPDRTYLNALLAERNQYPARAAEIDAQIRQTFERKVAVLALDMCGFSRLTAQFGIIHFLSMIHQMEQAARPAIQDNGGQVIKQEADNILALFLHPAQALEAACNIVRAFESMNAVLPKERDIYGSIGIGYGDTLVIGNEDVFGAEVNHACKLGEDIAHRREILLTPAAYEMLQSDVYMCSEDAFSIRGLDLRFFRFQRHLR